jgi:signal transduction histidine kinase
LEVARLRGYNAIEFEDSTSRRLIARSRAATIPVGRVTVPVAGGTVNMLVDGQALSNLLGREFPNLRFDLRPETERPARDAVAISQLTIDPAALERVVDSRRRRFRMFAAEGSFFLLLIIAGAIAIHRSLRRGAEFERRQQNFLAAVTHELKAPLASIRLFTETLSSRQLPPEKQRDCLSKIAQDVERLEELINDALEAGVFSRRSFHPALELNNLSEHLVSYVEMHRHRAERSGLQITTAIAPGVQARTDQVHLRRAVGVVIENAIKYSGPNPRGKGIRVSLTAEGRDAVITVADQGMGLEPADQKRVFERFYRAGDEMTRKVSGSGLGLYLAREIIEAHHGRIILRSDGPGTGATVEIRLPLAE